MPADKLILVTGATGYVGGRLLPPTTPKPGETYLEAYKIFCTDHGNNPFGI